jgi:hypothetical protein
MPCASHRDGGSATAACPRCAQAVLRYTAACGIVLHRNNSIWCSAGNPLTGPLWKGFAASAGSAAAAAACDAAAKQFTYVYTRGAHEKDLAKIPKLTGNLSRDGTAPGVPPAGSGAAR